MKPGLDSNAKVGALLRDLAAVQTSQQSKWGYRRAAQAILDLVAMPDPPLRLLLGNMAYDNVTGAHRRQLEEWARYETLARSADA
jgi:hypothetical protein